MAPRADHFKRYNTEGMQIAVGVILRSAFRDGKLRQGQAAVESALKDPSLRVRHMYFMAAYSNRDHDSKTVDQFVQARFEYAAFMGKIRVSHHFLTPILSWLLGGALLRSSRIRPTSDSVFAVVEHVEGNPPDLLISRLTESGRCVVTRIPDCPKAVVISVNLEERWAVVVGPKASMLNKRWRACSECAELNSSDDFRYRCCADCDNLVVPLIKEVSLDELECTRYAIDLKDTMDTARGKSIEMLSTPDHVDNASLQLTVQRERAEYEYVNRLETDIGVGSHWLFCGWSEHALTYRRIAAESVNQSLADLSLLCAMIKEKLIKDCRASEAEFDGHGSNVAILRIGIEKTGISDPTKDEDQFQFGRRILEVLWLKTAQTTN